MVQAPAGSRCQRLRYGPKSVCAKTRRARTCPEAKGSAGIPNPRTCSAPESGESVREAGSDCASVAMSTSNLGSVLAALVARRCLQTNGHFLDGVAAVAEAVPFRLFRLRPSRQLRRSGAPADTSPPLRTPAPLPPPPAVAGALPPKAPLPPLDPPPSTPH